MSTPELIGEPNYPRARVRHRCSWYPFDDSGGGTHKIEPGEYYERQTYATRDHGIYVWRTCAYHRAAAGVALEVADELDEYELAEFMHEWWGEAERSAERGQAYPMPFDAHAIFQIERKSADVG